MKNEGTKEKSTIKKILKILETILTIIAVFIAIIIVVQRISNNQNAFLSLRIFKVETGSMIPKYNIGDVLLVKENKTSNIEVGDDLVYEGEKGEYKDKIITHQVVEKIEKEGKTYFYTKGIANNSRDPIVSEEQVLGTVIHKLTIITFICNLLSNRFTLYFCIVLPVTLYVFFRIIHVNLSNERRKMG